MERIAQLSPSILEAKEADKDYARSFGRRKQHPIWRGHWFQTRRRPARARPRTKAGRSRATQDAVRAQPRTQRALELDAGHDYEEST